MIDFEKMSIEELEKRLVRLKENLEDIEEERGFILGQRGIHLSSSVVEKYQIEINDLNESINELEEFLQKKRDN
jgi:propanediol utilization protein